MKPLEAEVDSLVPPQNGQAALSGPNDPAPQHTSHDFISSILS